MARKNNKSQNSTPKKSHTEKTPQSIQSTSPAAEGQELAPAEAPTSRSLLSLVTNIKTQRALQLILLACIHAAVSQLNLSPVYGAVPAGLYHRYGLTAAFLLAFLLRGYLPTWIGQAITPFCFWIPLIQFCLFRLSSTLGNPLGPIVTECLTCFPIVTVSVYMAMDFLEEGTGSQQGDTFPSMGLFVLFTVMQRVCKALVAAITGPGFLRSRIGMQLMIASLYGTVLPKNVIWPSLPAVAFTMVANPHCSLSRTTEVLNNTLALDGYTLLERKESVTGYISVLDDTRRGLRVMRCDHSLLGGEWSMPSKPWRQVGEPIYAIFTMLEAVRLVEPTSSASEKSLLNIGLGIGTAPSAMIAHGVDTTIVEIDPVVHDFATKYFALPTNHTYYMGDALAFVSNTSSGASYDYIIHDVFTGGAEPAELFTMEFLTGLHTLLKPEGVIAINYAGDIAMPAASIIYRTITSVFPSCRVFREDEAPDPNVKPDDFTNMVFFCRKDYRPLTFRKPVEADFLGSGARREYMLPQHEIAPSTFDTSVDVLRSGKTKELEKWQAQSAIGHWKVMRTVLPDAIWENW
ncbi:S-adenosyl-L-methionine-dependent methyltransferase [Exophiala viscosa]|uniref:S-adenosyl-L-methionine-dependent methyltransferase n=1 Tax=Exophiala viscosa TaxID=2486360 RepID=A0AAN6E7X8_9EURO|nr:S-adenosyl-L-methionine-dependent methyltransferase [Exophiala viscosa]